MHHSLALAHEVQGFVTEAWTVVIHRPVAAPLPLVICHLNALFVVSKACMQWTGLVKSPEVSVAICNQLGLYADCM